MSDKYTILVGAGISLDAPSNFPIASKIMDAIIDGISPSEEVAERLKKHRIREDRNYVNMEKELRMTGDFIRFEMLIDVVSRFDKDLEVLDAISYYTNPNLNHYNLANLAIQGNFILTPNFDDLIERAIINLGYNPLTICTEDDYKTYCFESENYHNGIIPIFKLHGSYYKYVGNRDKRTIVKQTLQASLTSILSNNCELSLNEYKYKLLETILSKSSNLIVAGYSGSDDFDIVPALKKLIPYNLTWIDHDEKINMENIINDEISLINDSQQSGRNQLISKLYKQNNNIKLFKTHTAPYLKELGGITTLPAVLEETQDKICFEEHVKQWSKILSKEQKYIIVGNLYSRLSLIEEALELYNLVSADFKDYDSVILKKCSCLDKLSKFNEALELAEIYMSSSKISVEYNKLYLLEKIAYCKSNISTIAKSENLELLFTYVINEAQRHGDDSLLLAAYNDFGLYIRTYKSQEEAIPLYEESLGIAYKIGDLRHQGFVKNNLASIYYDMGDFVKAENLALEAYEKGDLYGDFRNHGVLENLLANISFIKGDLNNTVKYCDLSIKRDNILGNEIDSNVNYLLKGQALLEQGDFDKAEACFNKANSLFEKASSKDFLYELRLMQLILEIRKYHQGESAISNIHDRQLNIQNICGSPSESIINEISQNIAKCFTFENADKISFCEFLSKLYNLKEIPNYLHIIYYMCLLRISLKSIGIEHIRKAQKYYIQLSNVSRLEIINSYIKSNDIDNA